MPPRSQFPREAVLLYDSFLDRMPFFKLWKQKFEFRVPLQGGESLKTLGSYQKVLTQLSLLTIPQTQNLTFVAVGGGSVGDFTGFLASTFLRGRNFVQIPSTWLAAIDSAHGGKNGLNFAGVKNQIGTIYPASKVYLIKQLLKKQPSERIVDAMGEVLKIAIINTPQIIANLSSSKNDLFKALPVIIRAKMKVVQADPFEKMGLRRVLNLGHTMGHVFESYFKMSHGNAVRYGVLFSARWSFSAGILKEKDFVKIWKLLHEVGPLDLQEKLKRIPAAKIEKLLLKDKKMVTTKELDFIFIEKIGKVVRKKVSVKSIMDEAQRQKLEF